jgi:hypothetical protein
MLHDGACPRRRIRAVSLPRAHAGHGSGCQWLPMAVKKRQAERHDVTTTRHIQFSPVQSSPVDFSPALQGTATLLNAVQLHLSAPHLILAQSPCAKYATPWPRRFIHATHHASNRRRSQGK